MTRRQEARGQGLDGDPAEEAFRRGYAHGLNRANRQRRRMLELEREVKRLNDRLRGEGGQLRELVGRLAREIPAERRQSVFEAEKS